MRLYYIIFTIFFLFHMTKSKIKSISILNKYRYIEKILEILCSSTNFFQKHLQYVFEHLKSI